MYRIKVSLTSFDINNINVSIFKGHRFVPSYFPFQGKKSLFNFTSLCGKMGSLKREIEKQQPNSGLQETSSESWRPPPLHINLSDLPSHHAPS